MHPNPTALESAIGRLPREIVRDLLYSTEDMEWLRYVFLEYSSLFNTATRSSYRLLRKSDPCLLLDFDVIRTHIEQRSIEGRDRVAIEFLFERSELPYAIPKGAFTELISYLSRLHEFAHLTGHMEQDKENVKGSSKNSEGLNECLGDLFDSLGFDSSSINRSVLQNNLEIEILHADRLVGLLRSKRFRGVKTEHDDSAYEVWRDVILDVDRTEPRTHRDANDALNLAIATTPYLHSKKNIIDSPTYLLVSNTVAVTKLIRATKNPRSRSCLYDLFGVGFLNGDQFPVVEPIDAMVLELLGGFANPTAALAEARRLRNAFIDLVHLVEERLTALETLSDDERSKRSSGVNTFLEVDALKIVDILTNLALNYCGSQTVIREIEESRATATSVNLANKRQGSTQNSRDDSLADRSTGLLHLLDEISRSLSSALGTSYHINRPFPQSLPGAARFQVTEGDQQSSTSILSGEIYASTAPHKHPEYFFARWPVLCSEDRLREALQHIFSVPKMSEGRLQETSFEICKVEDANVRQRDGLMVITDASAYHVPLNLLRADGGWPIVELRTLQQALKDHLVRYEHKDYGSVTEAIVELRVHTDLADIYFDVVPHDGARRRYMTVTSRYRVPWLVEILCGTTSTRFILGDRLRETLSVILKVFPEYPVKG